MVLIYLIVFIVLIVIDHFANFENNEHNTFQKLTACFCGLGYLIYIFREQNFMLGSINT